MIAGVIPRRRCAFPRQVRLTDAQDYQRVFACATRATSRHFVMLARRNSLGHPRLGLAIAKKNLKQASDRNVVKRLIRESFRVQQHMITNIDIVVMVKRGITVKDKRLLHQSLDSLWLKLSKRCEES